jgi:hypothetical protein
VVKLHHERPLPRRQVGGCVEATVETAPDGSTIVRSTEALRWFPTA